ncbi:MAG: ribosome recycling factor [Candidatus Omnitrophica bacterium 4484_70.1]|nr:MAG: ribosome recycling factor [Candidatus Omnitrophica bacterium 4484_70.1]
MIAKQFLKEVENKMQKAVEAVKREFGEIRSGRANPKLVEGIRVDYYGSPTLLKNIATITVPEARLLVINPWDPNSIKVIEKAILESNLGITPIVDGKILKLVIPALSEERREELIKLTKKIAEEGRISVRTVRREAKEDVRKMEKEKKISEDERYRLEEELQKLTDKYIEEIGKVLEEKEKELKEF